MSQVLSNSLWPSSLPSNPSRPANNPRPLKQQRVPLPTVAPPDPSQAKRPRHAHIPPESSILPVILLRPDILPLLQPNPLALSNSSLARLANRQTRLQIIPFHH